MKVRLKSPARMGLYIITIVWLVVVLPLSVAAAPYAAMVMDARTGEVLHSSNANARLHPASLTKMMTLYIAFEAIEKGEIDLNTLVRISKNAAAEPPSKLGLRSGQKIRLVYLIRAAAVKSANDAATAIGEAISGSEAAFARRMNRTAKALGMTKTTFKNANGLTEKGHLSTAHDMTILGRHLLYDFPQYYNLFSRRTANAGMAKVPNTNRRLLANYKGADGIKTGYTRAAGFNLVASAERGNKRIIATVFGGRSSASRNARVAELLDLGFGRAPTRAAIQKPSKPSYGPKPIIVAEGEKAPRRAAGKIIRLKTYTTHSARPKKRPGSGVEIAQVSYNEGLKDDISSALALAQQEIDPKPQAVLTPRKRPARGDKEPASTDTAAAVQQVITRLANDGTKNWGVKVGRFTTRVSAEKMLLKTALAEMSTLDGSKRKVVKSKRGFDATFQGLSQQRADRACRRLIARNIECEMIGPRS